MGARLAERSKSGRTRNTKGSGEDTQSWKAPNLVVGQWASSAGEDQEVEEHEKARQGRQNEANSDMGLPTQLLQSKAGERGTPGVCQHPLQSAVGPD